jgi:Fic family protein
MEKSRAGSYQKMIEGYNAFLPATLPLSQQIDLSSIYNLLSEADRSIGLLCGIENSMPNFELIVRRYVEKEALLSSQIEGTQSSLVELLSSEGKHNKTVDVIEVENYFKALNHGIKRLQVDNFPFCLRLAKEIHEILMTGVRGDESANTPGEFRKSQNWIGGSKPSNAMFVPPPPHEVLNLLGNLEKYLHEDDLPPLAKCALIHYQFETIHPFCDGNGRTGRILITLYLVWKGLLKTPILYLSLYFKKNRQSYYDHLTIPRETGNFEKWTEFFLKGIVFTVKQVAETTNKIHEMKQRHLKTIAEQDEKIKNKLPMFEFLLQNPVVAITDVVNGLNLSHPTATTLIERFEKLGILEQISEGNRNKRYIYKEYMNILEEGCENF